MNIDCAAFHTSERVDQLMNEVETLYTNKLEFGNRTRAMQSLRLPPLEEKQARIVTFRLGMFIGMLLYNSFGYQENSISIFEGMLCLLIPLLIILGIILNNSYSSSKSINWRAALHLYRSSFFIILHIIFFGVNVYGWSKSGVNHVLIFEIDPRNHLTYQEFLELGTFLMVIWFLSFNIFFLSSHFHIYPFVQPLVFDLFLILFLINPLPIFYKRARMWFLKKLCRVFLSPFFHVGFVDFWLGDQLCSLELVFFDLEFFICFYIGNSNLTSSNPTHTVICSNWSQILLQTFFIILPSWFRFAQCLRRYRDTRHKFPHLVNAGKYASGFFVSVANACRRVKIFDYHEHTLENPFLYLWIVANLISSTYKVIWDLKMDWGLFDRNTGENKYLREQILYSIKSYYYVAIIGNILFRYIWMVNIFIPFKSLLAEYSDIIGFGFALIEIFRRFIWNYFRLENEHLTNCGEFRAIRDISIRPSPILTNNLRLEPITRQGTHNQYDKQANLNQNEIEARTRTTLDEIPMAVINGWHECPISFY